MTTPLRVGQVMMWNGSLWANAEIGEAAGFYDVRQYGDLTADSAAAATENTAAIQSAIDECAAAGGGTVLVPAGAYYTNAKVLVKSNVTLWLLGELYLADSSDSYMLAVDTAATNVRIRGGYLDGNKANNAGGGGIGCEDTTCRNVIVEGVTVANCDQDGIRMSGTDIKVLGCTAESNGTAGITGSVISYFEFLGNYARLNGTHGVGLIGVGTYGVIANNTAEANGPLADNLTGYNFANQYITWANNVSRAGGNNGAHVGGAYTTFSGNVIEDAADYGLIARNSDTSLMVGFVCVGNVITSSGDAAESGMWLGALSDFVVSGNVVKGSIAHGIYMLEGCVDGVVTGNTCNDNGGDGIRVDAVGGTCSQIHITGNICAGNTSDGIQITDATQITLQGNNCKDNARPATIGGASSAVKVIGNDFIGNTTDAPTLTAGTIDYWANTPNGGDFITAVAATLTLPVFSDYVRVTGTTTVTAITASWAGRRVTLRFGNDVCVITDGGNLRLAGDFTSSPTGDTLSLVCDGVDWYETGRSVN
jgi:parallel beta-helix repeat protein